jgi:DNA replication ATP-dependent helicase Dna2
MNVENLEKEKLGRIFFRTLQKLSLQKDKVDERILGYQFDVFQSMIISLTGSEKLLFNTLFARIAYLGIQLKLPSDFVYELHLYRREAQLKHRFDSYEDVYQLGLYLIARLLKEQYSMIIPRELQDALHAPAYERHEPRLAKFEHSMRGLITEFDTSKGVFTFIPNKSPDKSLDVSVMRLDLFQSSLQLLDSWQSGGGLPVVATIMEIGIDKQENLYPKWIILEPDYLVDVTSIAECFAPNGARPEYYLLNKFMPSSQSKYLLIGHLVNFILDELVNDMTLGFDQILHQVFRLAPFALSLQDDKTLVEIIKTIKQHYHNLVRVLQSDFPGLELDLKRCVVEPSFYAPELGLQGRLDVLHQNEKGQSSIIELKSGSPFMENRYGLSANHYTQTLLYDLMIRSVFRLRSKPLNYILYSKLPSQNLRFAPTINAAQMEAISIRNEILAIEKQLIDKGDIRVFEKLRLSNFPGVFGFLKEDLEKFEKTYSNLDDLEKAYFKNMSAFIALEQHYAKTGIHDQQENNGLAALWLDSSKQKQERFSIYTHLRITSNETMKTPPVLVLSKTNESNELANFRVGDIVIVRPNARHENEKIRGQVIRGTLIDQNETDLFIRLRSKQYDQRFFEGNNSWRLEHDFLDSGFRKMFQSLFMFAQTPEVTRKRLLGRVAPEQPILKHDFEAKVELTSNQNEVLKKMLESEDYYLLWGPPGTGKTSVILASAVRELLENTTQNILLLAYTNRAVDEICEMIEALSIDIDYLRIGSRYSTGEKFRDKLLEKKLEKISTRKELREMLSATRLVTGTTSSLSGKMELFELKEFDIVFIDEATQILEPMIIGMLHNFQKFVLIGDHRQLPAVVVQNIGYSTFKDKHLDSIGISGGHIALFDRMFHQCVNNDWHWAFGQLHEQGRMHEEIMQFPRDVFYGKLLKTLPGIHRLTCPLTDLFAPGIKGNVLLEGRMLFIDIQGDENLELAKNNEREAEKVAEVIQKIEILLARSGKEINDDTIGVITPFRAQVAQIRQAVLDHGLKVSQYTIDTVERYQGGARDFVIYSTVVNSEKRFQQILAIDENGLDRKLNVAVTRAREQFILIGNKTILSSNGLYKRLLGYCKEINL